MTQFVVVLSLLFTILVEVSHSVQGCSCEAPAIKTKYGDVKGAVLASNASRPFYAYRGIPFAKPPVAELRFRAPQPPEPWTNIRDCTKDAPMCIQKNYLFSEHPTVEGEEDCLYLNVYTPTVCAKKHEKLLPVMVNVHFGAFLAGTGRSDYVGPEYFMDKDVVLVTFNYRLGVFGLLSTSDDAAPGNWAFKDQVAALKWVQENIAAFGGDKERVTIFGESAGAGSVHLHLLSPATKGLFHKAISQSGSALSLWARPFNDLQAGAAVQQAMFVNCSVTEGSESMVDCLRGIDAVTLADSADKFKYISSEPLTVFGIVTEKETEANPNPYMTEDPIDIIKKGNFQRVPWILGVVQDEGILRVSPFLRNRSTWKKLNESFGLYGPNILGLALSVPETEIPSVWEKMTNYFLQANFVNDTDPEKVQGFINMFGDRSFKYGSYQSALMHAWKGHTDVWFYNFDYRGQYTYGDHFAGTKDDIDFEWGVCHADDLLYLFTSKALFGPLETHDDQILSKMMIQMWTNFAIEGDPSPKNSKISFKWNPIPDLEGRETVKNSDLYYLNIGGRKRSGDDNPITLEIRNEFLKERMQFWGSLPLAENIDGIE